MIAKLRYQHVRKQRRPRPSLLDRKRGHGRLNNRLAGAAAHFRADMENAFEVRGHVFEHFALVRADFAERLAAAARANARRLMHDGFLRQMIG
jgi:hypothetical protein